MFNILKEVSILDCLRGVSKSVHVDMRDYGDLDIISFHQIIGTPRNLEILVVILKLLQHKIVFMNPHTKHKIFP